MDKNNEKLRMIPRIVNDGVSLRLWARCVSVEEENDVAAMKALLADVERMPYAGSVKNPILKRMVKDGAGFDGLNAAMMTYGYLKHICLHFINLAK